MKPTLTSLFTMENGRFEVFAHTFQSIEQGRHKTMFSALFFPGINGKMTCFYTTELDAPGCPEYAGAVEEARSRSIDSLEFMKNFNLEDR